MQQIVIIGAGHAGFQCAASLRQEGFGGSIVLIGDEDCLPYQRPPLSKAYLLAKATASDLLFRPGRFFDEHRVRLVQARAEYIDRQAQRVALQSGENISYDHLVIATGSSPRQIAIEGASLEGVLSLQTLTDANGLRERLLASRRAVVVGAGFIGLEFAAVARTLGLEVTVVDVADRALARATSAECAQVVKASELDRHAVCIVGSEPQAGTDSLKPRRPDSCLAAARSAVATSPFQSGSSKSARFITVSANTISPLAL